MKIKFLVSIFLFAILVIINGCSQVEEVITIETDELRLESFFADYEGCFILYDEDDNKYSIYNEVQVNERISPCSTFKIPHSLIGLESGVIKGKDFIYQWDGKQYKIKSWNKNHTLETAIANSVVWYYQRLAQNIGEVVMQEYLNKINYGNKDITGGITKFWLGSTLEISAREQIEFLKNLYNDKLPFSTENMKTVREIIILESANDFVFSGKTGTAEKQYGWFVGTIKTSDNIYYFATNIKGEEGATGTKAKEITVEILKFLEIYNN